MQAIQELQSAIEEDEEGDKEGQSDALAKEQKRRGILGKLQIPAIAVVTLTGPIVLGRWAGPRGPLPNLVFLCRKGRSFHALFGAWRRRAWVGRLCHMPSLPCRHRRGGLLPC